MRIALIGNGPSRYLAETFEGDLKIGCNYPHLEVDYSMFVDAFAAKFLRKGAKHHNRLGEFKILLGERAMNGLSRIKHVPGSTRTLYEGLKEEGHVHDVLMYPKEFLTPDQKYLSSGHAAFLWAAKTHPDAEFHVYGMDSVFTGDHLATYSNSDVREWDPPHLERKVMPERREMANVWIEYWLKAFRHATYKSITFHGIEGDPSPPFADDKYNIKIEYHKDTSDASQ